MRQWLIAILLLLVAGTEARGHFIFVVPDADGATAWVFLSETLEPDADVAAALVKDAVLRERDAQGREDPLHLTAGAGAMRVALPGAGTRVVHGKADLGLQQHGPSPAFLLLYYPKTILGDAFAEGTRLGEVVPVELVAVKSAEGVRFEMLVKGKATAGADVHVIRPGEETVVLKTDDAGMTAAMVGGGRFGVWAKSVEKTPGDRDGKHYGEVRRYATLVVDVPAMTAAVIAPTTRAVVPVFGRLPQAAAAFGAVMSDGYLYVYGGHTAATHSYSTASVSGQFHRLKLSGESEWEQLPGGPPLQGMNLATYGGKIYRIGGMQPKNAPGTEADTMSVAGCAVFDPASGKWSELPALPEPRSSHDVVVCGSRLMVIGGWTLNGKAEPKWPTTALSMDLAAANPKWEAMEQPFARRALIVANYRGRVYAIGGFDESSDPSREVQIFDPASGKWSAGPALPEPDQNGFAPAACVVKDRLYVSVADGSLCRLNGEGNGWEKVGSTTPRLAHRIVGNGAEVLVLGGAAEGKNFDLIERVEVGE